MEKKVLYLGTKSETLERLQGRLKYAHILPQISFTVKEWQEQSGHGQRWRQCIDAWGKNEVIVRSSAINEDTQESSQAGKFDSVGNVKTEQEFVKAVDQVIASFDDDTDGCQILVQPMLTDVAACGVAFTLDPNTLGNYYVVNYDESGSTSAVTGGNAHSNKLLYIFKGKGRGVYPEYIYKLCLTLEEIERLFAQNNLDVEFAVSGAGELYLFQVRALCVDGQVANQDRQHDVLSRIAERIKRDAGAKPYLCGNRNIYSVMADWNPAEMIGVRPKPLALSLYRELITDNVWAYQRDNYGYRNLRSFPLMVDFGGLPYIDVRVSFNSFVPAGLDEDISSKLVNYYLERLAVEPEKHDKVEFDIVFSCYTLDLSERIGCLSGYGFSEEEINAIMLSLRDVTNRIIDTDTGLWRKDYEKIHILERRYDEIVNSGMNETEKIYWLLEDCKRYGTLPFAGLARGAFIAVQILKSLARKEIISDSDYQNFMSDINTVGSNMNHDFGTMSRKEFLKKYGHLRPGTYDINSLRYDEAPDLYFDWNKAHDQGNEEQTETKGSFSLSMSQMHRLKNALEESGLNNDILGLMDFIKTVIEGREYGKFVFTRSLSKIIQMIGSMGENCGLTRDDCAYLNIQAVKELYISAADTRDVLLKSAEVGKTAYGLTKTLTLPPVIMGENDVWNFYYPDAEPNFITMKKAQGATVVLRDDIGEADITGKIVLMVCADPGYDWIFLHHIKGFVTMYGGANSHMAIRAGELGIPAVIGVGEKRYEQCRRAWSLEIDAASKTLRTF